ncbi:DUF3281 family protein [Francisella philomiragia]|uniref:DUF3281 family protein n=1 Tax=Francisella philomiragia TaxID=28110 RepID=UPI001C9E106A|nr:DUF3281 family protein [Francisella philomiragia]MBY7735166.1 DUF3281 family protein [Francisella philomiragia]
MKINISIVFMLLTTGLLSSCGETKQIELYETEVETATQTGNDGLTVSLNLIKKNQELYTDMLGKERVVHEDITRIGDNGLTGNITWTVSGDAGGTWADHTTVLEEGLSSCQNDVCGQHSLPSAWKAEKEGYLNISAKGTITDADGNTVEINSSQTHKNIKINPKPNPTITEPTVTEASSVTFTLPDPGTGNRPKDLTAQMIVDSLNKNKDWANGAFSTQNNNSWTLTCKPGFITIDTPIAYETTLDYRPDNGIDTIVSTIYVTLIANQNSTEENFLNTGSVIAINDTTSANYFANGSRVDTFNIEFAAGCWPKQ